MTYSLALIGSARITPNSTPLAAPPPRPETTYPHGIVIGVAGFLLSGAPLVPSRRLTPAISSELLHRVPLFLLSVCTLIFLSLNFLSRSFPLGPAPGAGDSWRIASFNQFFQRAPAGVLAEFLRIASRF